MRHILHTVLQVVAMDNHRTLPTQELERRQQVGTFLLSPTLSIRVPRLHRQSTILGHRLVEGVDTSSCCFLQL
jgi:hypothetical protein